jgi:long-chain acyl-CoA synthetase
VLSGRKKELIINSYGKNINPVKVELMLREATGINHVMACGDNRPYCTALLWGCPIHDPAAMTAIEQGIRKINRELSHPEQVKKWAAIADKLSIEDGDLTANLKMKRPAIILKYAGVIEALYDKEKSIDGVLFGQID